MPTAWQRLKQAAENCKIELDHAEKTTVELPFLFQNKSLKTEISRQQFEDMVAPILATSEGPCRQCMADAGLKTTKPDKVLLVGGMTRTPAVRRLVQDIFGVAPDTSVNPLEAVACGAAIQAGVLTGQVDDVLLLDVTPLSLGIETLGGLFNPLIKRNTTIPTRQTEAFSTGVDNQTHVAIKVLQGERPIAQDNQLLGEFTLSGIPPMPRGTARIEVTFDIDANGIVNVSAVEKGSGKQQKVEVRATGGLSQEEIDRMLAEAASNAEKDRERKQRAEQIAAVDVLIEDVRLNLRKAGHVLPPEDRSRLEADVESLSAAVRDMSVPVTTLRARAGKLSEDTLATFQKQIHRKEDGQKE